MNCLFVQRNMPEFIENQLSPAQMKRLKAHFNNCPACRADLKRLQQSHQIMKNQAQISASYQLQLRLKNIMETESPPVVRSRWYQNFRLRLVYAVLLLALVWWGRSALIAFPGAHTGLFTFSALFLVLLCTALLILLRLPSTKSEN